MKFRSHNRLRYRFNHEAVNHSTGKYVTQGIVGAIHTNTIEGFWSLMEDVKPA